MRLHLEIKTTNEYVPFDHQPLFVGTIHKWLGLNEVHGSLAMFSFSRLEGGKASEKGLFFEKGTNFFFSSYSESLIKDLIKGIRQDPSMFHGLSVSEIIIQEDPDLSNKELFSIGSPILIKRREGQKIDHVLFNDNRASSCLKETLITKMNQANIKDDTIEISFDKSYDKAKSKMINYKGIRNKANWCPVIIKAKPETKLFAWNVGLGNSTGIGFGAIK